MARSNAVARQHKQDERQIRRHYVHWGVKTAVTLVVAMVCGAAWLAWKLLGAG